MSYRDHQPQQGRRKSFVQFARDKSPTNIYVQNAGPKIESKTDFNNLVTPTSHIGHPNIKNEPIAGQGPGVWTTTGSEHESNYWQDPALKEEVLVRVNATFRGSVVTKGNESSRMPLAPRDPNIPTNTVADHHKLRWMKEERHIKRSGTASNDLYDHRRSDSARLAFNNATPQTSSDSKFLEKPSYKLTENLARSKPKTETAHEIGGRWSRTLADGRSPWGTSDHIDCKENYSRVVDKPIDGKPEGPYIFREPAPRGNAARAGISTTATRQHVDAHNEAWPSSRRSSVNHTKGFDSFNGDWNTRRSEGYEHRRHSSRNDPMDVAIASRITDPFANADGVSVSTHHGETTTKSSVMEPTNGFISRNGQSSVDLSNRGRKRAGRGGRSFDNRGRYDDGVQTERPADGLMSRGGSLNVQQSTRGSARGGARGGDRGGARGGASGGADDSCGSGGFRDSHTLNSWSNPNITLPISKNVNEFKHGEPDSDVVKKIVKRIQNLVRSSIDSSTKSDAGGSTEKNLKINHPSSLDHTIRERGTERSTVKTSNNITSTESFIDKRAQVPPHVNEEEGLEPTPMEYCFDHELKGEWWVEDLARGTSFPKLPKYRTWCQEAECLQLKHFACDLRHHYQNEYYVGKGFDFNELEADPDGMGAQDPPFHYDDTPLVAAPYSFEYTGNMLYAATGRDYAQYKPTWRKGRR